MRFDIQDSKRLAERLRWDDLDLGGFEDKPLDQDALRCLRYMHDVEFHTACYLRDLLVSPAHADPDLTSFLAIWAFEELWHGEAIAAVIGAHGESSGGPRVHMMRQNLGAADRLRSLVMLGGSWLAGENLLALQMAWGAINEMTTQAGYALLGSKARHPLLSALLKRIMVQEGRHMDFYASQAGMRLAASAPARRLTRSALRWLWSPVGSKVMPSGETEFIATYLFSDVQGIKAIRRIDRRIDRLPGLGGMNLTRRWFERFP
ncbi:MAG: ferritin-like domain-containing protein [Acidimicrobiales bacterium]